MVLLRDTDEDFGQHPRRRFGAPSPAFSCPNLRPSKPSTLMRLNLPAKEMSEIDSKLDANRP